MSRAQGRGSMALLWIFLASAAVSAVGEGDGLVQAVRGLEDSPGVVEAASDPKRMQEYLVEAAGTAKSTLASKVSETEGGLDAVSLVQLGLGEESSPSHEEVSAAAGKYLCFRTGLGSFGSDSSSSVEQVIGIHFVRCDQHATCDAKGPTCTCETGYTGNGNTCALVDCGAPKAITNGAAKDFGKTTYKEKSYAECDSGYVLTGPEFRTCQADGKWTESDAETSCPPRSCGVPDSASHGTTTCPKGHTFSNVCTLTCEDGYELEMPTDTEALKFVKDGKVERTCNADGTWSGFNGKCLIKHCGLTNEVVLGKDECPHGDRYGDKCTFTCENGHHLVGKATNEVSFVRNCLKTGLWDDNTATKCEIDQCPALVKPQNGGISCSATSFGGSCQFTCNSGYDLIGDTATQCMKGGTWSNAVPTCKIKDCRSLNAPNGGTVTMAGGTTYGQTAKYTCNTGYDQTAGTMERTCQSDGLWSGNAVTCTIKDCGRPATPADAIVSNSPAGTTYGKKLVYTCATGHTPAGDATRTCGANGLWSGTPFTCTIKDCGGLDTPLNAKKACSETTYGKVCYFVCNEGYHLTGDQSRTCGPEGTWTNSQPTCVLHECATSSAPSNGRQDCDGQTWSKECRFFCNTGYTLNGRESQKCDYEYNAPSSSDDVALVEIGEGGSVPGFTSDIKWYGQTPKWVSTESDVTTCTIVDCGTPQLAPVIAGQATNGKTTCASGTTYGQSCTHTCETGYKIAGVASPTCNEFGSWGTPSRCVPITCGELTAPANGAMQCAVKGSDGGDVSSFGAKCTFGCDEGHTFSGTRERECGADTKWAGIDANCNPQSCPVLEAPQHGTVDLTGGVKFGNVAKYSCDDGYVMTPDTAERTCSAGTGDHSETGAWSGSAVVCQPKDCGKTDDILGAANLDKSLSSCTGDGKYPTTCITRCKSGYENSGGQKRECGTDGAWTSSNAVCTKVTCPTFVAPDNAAGVCTGDKYEDKCVFECKTGYTGTGATEQICQAEKVWSGTKLQCVIKDCKTLPTPTLPLSDGSYVNAAATCDATTYGGKCSFTCPTGYDMITGLSAPVSGNHEVKCGEDGSWTGTTPVCKKVVCPVLNVENAAMSGNCASDNVYQAKCSATCVTGYISAGDVEHTCDANGKWTGKDTSCTIVSCTAGDGPALPTPSNGYASCTGSTYLKTCAFGCDTGYEISGDQVRTCQASGGWSGASTSCSIKQCPSLTPSGSEIIKCGTDGVPAKTYGTTCAVSCPEGMEQTGSALRTCQDNKAWSGASSTCKQIDCGGLSSILNGATACADGTEWGKSCVHTCDDGYTLIGSASRKCTGNSAATAAYDGVAAVCSIKDCGELPAITDAKPITVTGTKDSNKPWAFGAVATFECNHGYALKGKETRTCGANGLWSGSAPTCELIKCPTMNAPKDGVVECTGDLYQKECSFTCNTGHTLSGSTKRVCQADNRWDGVNTVCTVMDCNGLPSLTGGSTSCKCPANEPACSETGTDKHTYGKTCSFTCDTGYVMSGSVSSRTCRENDAWTGTQPSCSLFDCGKLSTLEPIVNGQMACVGPGNGQLYGAQCSVTCDVGYKFYGEHTRKCEVSGWSGDKQECKIVECDPLTAPADGRMQWVSEDKDKFQYNTKLQFTCNTGYHQSGTQYRTCKSDGTWDGSETKCAIKSCDALEAVENGSISGSGSGNAVVLTYGSVVTYSCDAGHELNVQSPENKRTCQADQTWSGPTPSCDKHKCSAPDVPKNGELVGTCSHFYQGECTFKCNSSYRELNGNARRSCLATKLWSGSTLTCNVKTCDAISAPPHASMVCSGGVEDGENHIKSKCQFTCDNGYKMAGDQQLECEDGGWKGTMPTCTIVDCKTQPAAPHGRSQNCGTGTEFGTQCTFACDEGYDKTSGSEVVSCQVSAAWETSTGVGQLQCAPKDCKAPPALANTDPITTPRGTAYHADTTKRGIAQVKCKHGYKFAKDENIEHSLTCQADGTWGGDVPPCIIVTCPAPDVIHPGTVDTCNSADSAYKRDYGQICSSSCETGWNFGAHMLSTKTQSRTCQADGTWDVAELPKCEQVSCSFLDLGTMNNGALDCLHEGGNLYNKHCKATCNVGYELQAGSTEIRTCQEDATWCKNDKPTTCVAKQCAAMPSFPNGKMTCPDSPTGTQGHLGIGLVYQQACEFECNVGYVWSDMAIGSTGYTAKRTRDCQSDKSWSKTHFVCIKRTCDDIAVIDGSTGAMTSLNGGTMSCGSKEASGKFGYGATCDFTCNAGYTLVGSKQLKCDVASTDMNWTGTTPKCVGTGMTLGKTMYMKSNKWNTVLAAKVAQCQRFADQYEPSPAADDGRDPAPTGCRCMNWKIKKPDWGLDSECCADPQQAPKGKPWCFCDNTDYGGTGWSYCDASKAPALAMDVTEDKTSANAFIMSHAPADENDTGADQTHLQYGKHIYIKTKSAPVKFVVENTQSNTGAFKFVDSAGAGSKWLVTHPTKQNYYGYVAANTPVVLKSETNKYVQAFDKKETDVTTYVATYQFPKCRDNGYTSVCVAQPNKDVYFPCNTKGPLQEVAGAWNGWTNPQVTSEAAESSRRLLAEDLTDLSPVNDGDIELPARGKYADPQRALSRLPTGAESKYVEPKRAVSLLQTGANPATPPATCYGVNKYVTRRRSNGLCKDCPAGRTSWNGAGHGIWQGVGINNNWGTHGDPCTGSADNDIYCSKGVGDCRAIPTEEPCIGGTRSVAQDCINTSMCKGDAPNAASKTDGYYESPGKFVEYVATKKQMSPCNRGDVRCAAILTKPGDDSEVFTISLE